MSSQPTPFGRHVFPRAPSPPRHNLPNAKHVYRAQAVTYAAHAQRVLDLGCGKMHLLGLLPNSALRVGIDLVPLHPPAGIHGINANAERLPLADRSFDLVLCTSVLEHLDAPVAVFREIRRVLAPDGSALLLTPNRWDYVSLAASCIPNRWHPSLVRRLTGRAEDDTFPTRYRANTRTALVTYAREAGLRVRECRYLREHPHYLRALPIAYRLGSLYEQSVQRGVPWLRPWLLMHVTAPPAA